MLTGIEGELGGGKTLLLVRYLQKENKINKREILTNLTLTGIPYKPLNILELLENNTELNNVVLGIDELTVYTDCRMSMSKANRFFSYLVLQSRKRNVDVYYTTQSLGMIESRVVDHTYFIILCEKVYDKFNKLLENYRYYTIFDFRNRLNPKIKHFVMDIRPFFKFYDTNQIITPIYEYAKEKKVSKKA